MSRPDRIGMNDDSPLHRLIAALTLMSPDLDALLTDIAECRAILAADYLVALDQLDRLEDATRTVLARLPEAEHLLSDVRDQGRHNP